MAAAAKARGLEVVVVNQSPLPHSGPFRVPDGLVDELFPVDSWSDEEQIRAVLDEICARYEIAGSYAAFEGALPFDAELRERVGLPTSGAAVIRAALDKGAVRSRLHGAGLSRLGSTDLVTALGWESWGFPGAAILKPVHGTGSALCFTVSSLPELRAAAEEIERSTLAGGMTRDYVLGRAAFVLEQKAEGELLSVESLVFGGEVRVVGLMGRYVLAADPVVEQGTIFPYQHPRHAEIAEAAVAFHRFLGITHGPTHLEVMVPEEGPIELIDFNLRAAGVAATVTFGLAHDIRYQELLTDLGCGLAPDTSALGRNVRWTAECLVLPRPGTTELRDISFPDTAQFVRVTKELGAPLSGRSDQLDAVAMFVVTAGTPEQLHRVALDARRRTVVNGEPLGDNPNNDLTAPRHLRTPQGVPA
ncbi:acetyl-CoA carboxylase biotin carboxylase subunit family protein [Kitasatospora sp. NPDC056138]|uniref:ATP-grasp domain-containing protein n=1 Tax=Kitasatospora sp. NPDC056138 TaxID=3345724 RepID=UPI0035DD055D